MWNGYVKEGSDAFNENLAKSLDEDFDYMHTSGHVDMADLRKFFRLLNPKQGIIPIHTEDPDAFAKEFSDEWTVFLLNDGDPITVPTIEVDYYYREERVPVVFFSDGCKIITSRKDEQFK